MSHPDRRTLTLAALLAAALPAWLQAAVVTIRLPAGPRPTAAPVRAERGQPPPPSRIARPRDAKGMRLLPADDGLGAVRFDLGVLPAGAKIRRADLLAARSRTLSADDEAALLNIEIYPLAGDFVPARRPKATGKPLALRGPWFDRFDATEAVRAGAARKAPAVLFLVKTFPYWRPEATCLEVVFEGTPRNLPPQVTGVQAFHRSGQTFITWKEVPLPGAGGQANGPVGSIASASPPSGKDEPKWGELKSVLAGLDSRHEVRYCVYRSRKHITAESLADAERIAAVSPLSCWNVNGRNIEKPIDELLTKHYLDHHQWNPFVNARVEGKYGLDCKMERLVIRDKAAPLPRGTGLYVHTTREKGRFHYAVVTSVDGVQNTGELSKANSLRAPLAESPAQPEPVLQKQFPPRPYWNYAETRLHYVRWVGPPYGNRPCQYYNWSVGVPAALGKAAAGPGGPASPRRREVGLELNLHRDGRSYYVTPYRLEPDSLVLVPHDFPLKTWWYGYHEAAGTLKSFRQGAIHDYTERRVLWFLQWAARKWAVDRNRMVVTGISGSPATGALHLALRHPELFNMVIVGYGFADYRGPIRELAEIKRGRYVPDVERIWGKLERDLKTHTGRSVWDELDCTRKVRDLPPTTELPVVTMTGRSVYKPSRDFYTAMLDNGHAIMANFGTWGGGRLLPVSVAGTWTGRMLYQDVRRNLSLPALKGPGTGILYAPAPKGRYTGAFNHAFRWGTGDLVDRADRYEISIGGGPGRGTTDVTLRRLQAFKVVRGQVYAWQWRPVKETRYAKAQAGEVTVGAGGVLTVPALTIPREGGRLIVTRK